MGASEKHKRHGSHPPYPDLPVWELRDDGLWWLIAPDGSVVRSLDLPIDDSEDNESTEVNHHAENS